MLFISHFLLFPSLLPSLPSFESKRREIRSNNEENRKKRKLQKRLHKGKGACMFAFGVGDALFTWVLYPQIERKKKSERERNRRRCRGLWDIYRDVITSEH